MTVTHDTTDRGPQIPVSFSVFPTFTVRRLSSPDLNVWESQCSVDPHSVSGPDESSSVDPVNHFTTKDLGR